MPSTMDPRAYVEFPFLGSPKATENRSLAIKRMLRQSRGPCHVPHFTQVWQEQVLAAGTFSQPSFLSTGIKISENYSGFLRLAGNVFKTLPGDSDGSLCEIEFSISSSPFLNLRKDVSLFWNHNGNGQSEEEWPFRKQDIISISFYNRNTFPVTFSVYLCTDEIRW
jgi:hypothetical protein